MPEKCRVGVVGFDPMLVRGYVKTGYRGLWWYLSDELYEKYKVPMGAKIEGKVLAVYNYQGKKTFGDSDPFEWTTAKESGLAVVLPGEAITKYELTEFHFLELLIEKVDGKEVFPGEEKKSKWWPEERMKLDFHLDYMAP